MTKYSGSLQGKEDAAVTFSIEGTSEDIVPRKTIVLPGCQRRSAVLEPPRSSSLDGVMCPRFTTPSRGGSVSEGEWRMISGETLSLT